MESAGIGHDPSPHAAPSVSTTHAEARVDDTTPVEQRDDPEGAWRRAANLVATLAERVDARSDDSLAIDLETHTESMAGEGVDAHAPSHAPRADAGASSMAAEIDGRANDTLAPQGTSDSTGTTDANNADDTATPVAADGGRTDGDAMPARLQGAPARATPPGSATRKSAPSFAAPRHAPSTTTPRHRWLAPATIAALSGLLLLQILLADRARLSMDASWRPLLTTLCGALGCNLPPWREPAAIHLVTRDVRAHPTQPGVLRATATLRNDARWPQAWPRVVLTLSDVDGRSIGMRDFAPDEYLGETPTETTLSSGQSAMIRLDVLEPAANVVAFSFDFH